MKNKSKILPVLFGFFIMGFCDLVGVSVTYAKDYFSWSETQAGFLPSMVFIWFLLISIPISIWMDKKGRKTISLIGLLSTFIGMLLPLLTFTQTACYIAFALLGIGNTILQVSLNPLLIDKIEFSQFDNPSFIGLNITLLINLYCGVQIIIVKY